MNIESFLKESETFAGISFSGNYDMPTGDFVAMLEYYQKTNVNLLDDYTNMVHLIWSKNDDNYYSREQLNKFIESQSRLRHSRIFDYDWLADCRTVIKEKSERLKNEEIRQRNIPRKQACSHTSKEEIRNAVFEKYGKKCLCCGSTENLTIDHVIPVSKEGINDISNYQPLCKSCNSKKHDKIIDYRKGLI
jgi:5-methylcytosine-specific restriction endonuclease McrA